MGVVRSKLLIDYLKACLCDNKKGYKQLALVVHLSFTRERCPEFLKLQRFVIAPPSKCVFSASDQRKRNCCIQQGLSQSLASPSSVLACYSHTSLSHRLLVNASVITLKYDTLIFAVLQSTQEDIEPHLGFSDTTFTPL